mgnify:CR=1 FL=1
MNSKKSLSSKIISGSFWKFGERMSAQAVSFFVSLILTRILSPSDYGIIAIINIFIAIADVFLASGLNTALIQKKNPTRLDYNTIFWCNIILGCILYLVLFLVAPVLTDFYNIPILTPVIRIFALRLPISSFQSIQSAFVSKHMQFKKFFYATFLGSVVSAVVGIAMAYTGFGVWALVAQYLVNTVVGTVTLFAIISWRPKFEFSFESAKPLVQYGWKIMFTDLTGTIFNNLGDFIIGARYNSSSLAFYSKGRQLPYLIRNNIFTSLISVLFPGMSQVNDDIERIKSISRKSISVLSFLIFPTMVGLIVTAEPLTILMYTEKWLPITPFVVIVCSEAILSVIPTVTMQTIKALGRSDLTLKIEFIKKPFYLLTIFIALNFGIVAIALTLIINAIIEMITNGLIVQRLIKYSLWEQLNDMFDSLIISILMGLISYLVVFLNLNIYFTLLLQVVVGIFSYLILAIAFKNKSFIELKNRFFNTN